MVVLLAATSVKQLETAGFQHITESNPKDWVNLKPNGKYYYTRYVLCARESFM